MIDVYRTSHQLMCEMLREVLRNIVQTGSGAANEIGSVPNRAVAALYMLLMAHPVDRRGRCRSCRYPGAMFRSRWRRCRVHREASVWLYQPADFVASQLTRALGPADTAHQSTITWIPAVPPSGGVPQAGRPVVLVGGGR